MALAAYALTSAAILLAVFAVWQAAAVRTTTGADRRAARRSAVTFGAGAVVCGLAAGLIRLLA